MSPASSPASRPIILIGSSRSGTGIVTRVLRHNGVFMGADLESNAESKTMQALNRWVMLNAGACLERPHGIDALLADPFMRRAVGQVVRAHIDGRPGWRYWGVRRLWRPTQWGFKDPRSTFTLPIWLDLFPEAQVVHVLRHGVDVALSLQARRRRVEQRWAIGEAPSPAGLVAQHRAVANFGVSELRDGFAHWRAYVDRAQLHGQRLGPARFLTVRYEQLLERPAETVAALGTFLGRRLRTEGLTLHADRAWAHRAEKGARLFAAAKHPYLHGYGYPV